MRFFIIIIIIIGIHIIQIPDKLSPEDFRNHVLEEIKHKVEREVNQ
jgi:hypothetical protein